MTNSTAECLRLQSPAALCCAIPYLLGFQPEQSAVLLWMDGSRLILTQRVDLPPEWATAKEIQAWAAGVWQHEGAADAESVVVVLMTSSLDESSLLSASLTAEALTHQAEVFGTTVQELLHVAEDRWRRLLGRHGSEVSSAGGRIDPVLRRRVAAHFAVEDDGPLESRVRLAASMDPAPSEVEAVEATGILQAGSRCRGSRRERWRDVMISGLVDWVSAVDPTADPKRSAHMLLSLRDVRVRDTFLWEIARLAPADLHTAIARLTVLVRSAPPGDTAPVATCLGLTLWLTGDGARANVAAHRALLEAPHYSLAAMLDEALARGFAPRNWADIMRELQRETCRHGS